ncbi:MAG: DUF302 domain-containing protein [Cyclobacteriaceae bacterium]
MGYHYSKKSNKSFADTLVHIKESLKKEGFGVLTEIDIKETFKNKLGIDFRNYQIMGACNPTFAHKALTIEPTLGVMLPCNIAVQEYENGDIVVSAINPMESMALSVQNDDLEKVATEVSSRLNRAVDAC